MKNKRDTINLLFSAFLITAFIICSYFFSGFADGLSSPMNSIVISLIFVVFGLLLFYSTRVGEGRAVKRFSLLTLIILDLPALYIIIASFASGLPLHDMLVVESGLHPMVLLASIALGYGIPYTFLSGFELVTEEIITDMPDVEGGIKEDVDFTPEAETTYAPAKEDDDEIVVEGTNIFPENDPDVEVKTIDEAVSEETEKTSKAEETTETEKTAETEE